MGREVALEEGVKTRMERLREESTMTSRETTPWMGLTGLGADLISKRRRRRRLTVPLGRATRSKQTGEGSKETGFQSERGGFGNGGRGGRRRRWRTISGGDSHGGLTELAKEINERRMGDHPNRVPTIVHASTPKKRTSSY